MSIIMSCVSWSICLNMFEYDRATNKLHVISFQGPPGSIAPPGQIGPSTPVCFIRFNIKC